MPPAAYMPVHPEATLTDQEKQALIDGLRATVAINPPPPAQTTSQGRQQAKGGPLVGDALNGG